MTENTGIYAIENLRDRRAYVGATRDGFLRRWAGHRIALTRGIHHSPALQQDWNTLGAGWFKFVPLQVISITQTFGRCEQFWIGRLQVLGYRCYNVQPGAEYGPPRQPIRVGKSDSVYTLQDVATWAKITVAMVRAMIKRGELSAIRVGRLLRVRHEDLDAFMTRQQTHQEPPQEPDMC